MFSSSTGGLLVEPIWTAYFFRSFFFFILENNLSFYNIVSNEQPLEVRVWMKSSAIHKLIHKTILSSCQSSYTHPSFVLELFSYLHTKDKLHSYFALYQQLLSYPIAGQYKIFEKATAYQCTVATTSSQLANEFVLILVIAIMLQTYGWLHNNYIEKGKETSLSHSKSLMFNRSCG